MNSEIIVQVPLSGFVDTLIFFWSNGYQHNDCALVPS